MNKPVNGEYNPYFNRYLDLVPEGKFSLLFSSNTEMAVDFFSRIPADKYEYRYAEGKWSIKEILQHIVDTERVMVYRALAAARKDSEAVLTNMNEDEYAKNAAASGRMFADIIDEFKHLRISSQKFFEGLNEEEQLRAAKIKEYSFTPRAAAYILIGHLSHHINTINERYL